MKNIFLIIFVIFSFTACATWDGVKKDSNTAWEKTKEKTKEVYKSTKKKIHEATADDEKIKIKEDK